MQPIGSLAPEIRDRIEFDANSVGCWLWHGAHDSNGYGSIYIRGPKPKRSRLAHRVIYELLAGSVPEGLELDHLCRIRDCVNPEHLEPVTHAENLRRGNGLSHVAVRTNTCQRGHVGKWYARPDGTRYCAECKRVGELDRRREKRAGRVDLLAQARERIEALMLADVLPREEWEAIEWAILGQPQKWGKA